MTDDVRIATDEGLDVKIVRGVCEIGLDSDDWNVGVGTLRRIFARLDKAERELAELKAQPTMTDRECAKAVVYECAHGRSPFNTTDENDGLLFESVGNIIAVHCAAKVAAAVKPWRRMVEQLVQWCVYVETASATEEMDEGDTFAKCKADFEAARALLAASKEGK